MNASESAAIEVVAQEHFESAEDLLAALSPASTAWDLGRGRWVFRGHGDADWPLIPSAHRATADQWRRFGLADFDPGEWALDHVERIERRLLEEFVQACDRSGLSLPNAPSNMRAAFCATASRDWCDFCPEAMALAQHHGIPTRLLDWTRLPRHAAYFAASAALRQTPRPERIAVWALDTACLRPGYGEHEYDFELVTAPASSNAYLHAQRGVFTIVSYARYDDDKLPYDHRTPFDRVLAQHFSAGRYDKGRPKDLFRKLTAPAKQARRLLQILHYDGVDGGSLFPSYDGVVRGIQDQANWRAFWSPEYLKNDEDHPRLTGDGHEFWSEERRAFIEKWKR